METYLILSLIRNSVIDTGQLNRVSLRRRSGSPSDRIKERNFDPFLFDEKYSLGTCTVYGASVR